MELVHQARARVVITTPYFVPDESLLVSGGAAMLIGAANALVTFFNNAGAAVQ